MQDLTTILLILGGLLLAYGSKFVVYSRVRREVQKDSAGRPINQIPRWNSYCWNTSFGLFAGAGVWTVQLPVVFAYLDSLLSHICPLLVTRDECRRAALVWQATCVGLGCTAVLVISIVASATNAEAKRTPPPSERSYPLKLLSYSVCSLTVSWLLCTPLSYSLEVSRLVGPRLWIGVNFAWAFIIITLYTLGTSLWIIAALRVFHERRRISGKRTPVGA